MGITTKHTKGTKTATASKARAKLPVIELRHGPGTPDVKARNLTRLKRLEGQMRGLQRMVEEERYCADILTQISSVHEALRAVSRELMRDHLKHCAAQAIRSGDEKAEPMYDELVDMMYRSAR
jgi:DNA-binding FrmR family transcriptional regulator